MKMLLPILALLLLSAVTFADSTQQYNKLYLNPFYKDSLMNNMNSSFSVTVNPPDRIMDVKSAILYFNIYATGQTTNYSLWMNGQQCNTKNFYVSTTYASSGQVQLSFDCTNILKTSGDYSIIIRPSGSNTGAVTGWLEITYMNNPKGEAQIGGTDYWKGEAATVFVQLQDANGNAVNNASCSFDMYNTTNPLLNPIYWKQPMVFRGADGIYYYQFSTTGLPSGVYPLDAECSYVYDNFFFWHQSLTDIINWTVNTGTYDSGTGLDMNFFDDQSGLTFLSTTVGAARAFNVTFRFDNISSNITQLDYYWQGEIIQSPAGSIAVTWYALNKTSNSYNIVLGTQTIATTTAVTGQNALFTARIPANAFQNSSNVSIQVWATSGNTNTKFFTDWQTLKAFRNTTYVTGVKGSSEVHIYPINITDMPQMVWNYSSRTLTEYNNSAIYNNILDANLTLHNAINAANLSIQNAISNVNSTLYNEILAINTTLPSAVWAFNSRTLTDYNLTEIKSLLTGMSNLTAAQVWNYSSRNLTYYNLTETYNLLTGMSNLTAAQVWSSANRNLTFYNNTELYNLLIGSSNLTALQVWNFSNRTLTDYNTTELYHLLVGSANMTPAQVWSFANRTLTDYNLTQLTTIQNLLTGMSNLTAAQVWNYADRNLTWYNNSDIFNAVLNITPATPAQFWNYSTRTLTDYNLTEIKSLLVDTNNTVYMNKASLATALVLLATINSTVFAINSNTNGLPSSLSDLIATTHQTNSTVNAVWAFLQNQTLNITINATAVVNSTQIAEDLANFDIYEYYVTPTGNVPIATGSLFGGIAYAAPNGYSSICLNQNTLQTTVVKVRCIDNNCKTIETNTTEQCNYGCDSTSYPPACSPSTSTAGMWFFFIIIFIVIVMILLVRWATKRY